jgi:hypothetical protein
MKIEANRPSHLPEYKRKPHFGNALRQLQKLTCIKLELWAKAMLTTTSVWYRQLFEVMQRLNTLLGVLRAEKHLVPKHTHQFAAFMPTVTQNNATLRLRGMAYVWSAEFAAFRTCPKLLKGVLIRQSRRATQGQIFDLNPIVYANLKVAS